MGVAALALDRATIVNAGLDLLDQQGLDGLTMRHLAKAIGIKAPSLYWHYRDKSALLADMADALVQRVGEGIDRRQHFRISIGKLAEQFLSALLARRDGAMVFAASPLPGPHRLRMAHTASSILTTAGFEAEMASRSTAVLFSYVLGHALHAQASHRNVLPMESAGLDRGGQFSFGIGAIIAGMGAPLIEDPQFVALMRAFSAVRQG